MPCYRMFILIDLKKIDRVVLQPHYIGLYNNRYAEQEITLFLFRNTMNAIIFQYYSYQRNSNSLSIYPTVHRMCYNTKNNSG